ncbi:hypothetical protein BDR07DRAFT_1386077 [Suillus spraguei]|nr:hypothetical protein BDR07DRAFT_1386077 [Suillus spraguei]
MGLQEHNLRKYAKIDYLRLMSVEWIRVGQFADLLLVHYADIAQQKFSSDAGTTLHLAVPALKALNKAWSSRAGQPKYSCFAPALDAAADKINKYNEKTTESPTYVMTMVLNPMGKMAYFKKNWPEDLQQDVLACAEQLCENLKLATSKWVRMCQHPKLASRWESSGEDEDIPVAVAAPLASAQPWQADFTKYMDTLEAAPLPGMCTIQWWGINAQRYGLPVPLSLMEDVFEIEEESGEKSEVEDEGWDGNLEEVSEMFSRGIPEIGVPEERTKIGTGKEWKFSL